MQLKRELALLETQERSDQRRKKELENLSVEIAEQAKEDPVNAGKYLNYRDCRPATAAKRAEQKKTQNKTQLQPKPSQQSVLTNQLIAAKLSEAGSSSQAVPSAAASSRRAPAKKGGAVAAGSARSGTAAASARSGFSSSSTQKAGGVVKTIVLPHEDINRLGTEAQELT